MCRQREEISRGEQGGETRGGRGEEEEEEEKEEEEEEVYKKMYQHLPKYTSIRPWWLVFFKVTKPC